MKTLHVEAGMHLYGGALQVVFLLQGLKARGEEAVLVCPRGSAVAQAARAHAAQVHEIEMKGDLDIGLVARLRRLIRAERPALVHLHSRRGVDLWGGLAARREGVPAVLSRRVDNPEARWWVGAKYRLYERVVAISEGIRQVLLAEGLRAEQVVRVHSAVDTQRFRPGRAGLSWFRSEFGLPEDAPTLAMAAQFIPRKGHRTLLEALPAVLAVQPRVRVLLFGRGPELDSVRRQVQAAGLGDCVVFGGFRGDLERVLPCVDVMVHPAEMEGLGVALLQAAACAVPIVATRAGGIPEVVCDGENGLLVAPGDVAALALALQRLLASPTLRRQYGDAGRARVLRSFSVDPMVDGNRAVYEAVIRERRGAVGPSPVR